MGVWIAMFLLLCTLWYTRKESKQSSKRISKRSTERSTEQGTEQSSKEGFNPNHPDERPTDYPDQSYSAHLIQAEKHIHEMLATPSSKTPYLEDLLMLLQKI